MRYFSHLSNYHRPGNRLQTAALDLLKANSNILIGDLDVFIAQLFASIEDLNRQFPRSRPLTPTLTRQIDGHGLNVPSQLWLGNYTVFFKLHRVKETEHVR